jgi:hypothetical protein
MPINNSSEQAPAAGDHKKPYEKPAFRHEQVFVTTALSCGKLAATGMGHCGLPSQSAS